MESPVIQLQKYSAVGAAIATEKILARRQSAALRARIVVLINCGKAPRLIGNMNGAREIYRFPYRWLDNVVFHHLVRVYTVPLAVINHPVEVGLAILAHCILPLESNLSRHSPRQRRLEAGRAMMSATAKALGYLGHVRTAVARAQAEMAVRAAVIVGAGPSGV
jgi:hypothetical protein